jgi:Protein of unknown function (DUF2721)
LPSPTPKFDEALLFRTFLSPVVFFSATAMLTGSINIRMVSIVNRLRHYIHAKHDAVKNAHHQEVEAYTDQIQLLRNRAELIRRAFMFALAALTGTLLSCLLLGLAAEAAAIVFVLSMISLLVCVAFYFREVSAALRAVQEEANDLLSADKPYLLPFIGRSR